MRELQTSAVTLPFIYTYPPSPYRRYGSLLLFPVSLLLLINMGIILNMGNILLDAFPNVAIINQYVGGCLVALYLISIRYYHRYPQTEVMIFALWLIWSLSGFFIAQNIFMFTDTYMTTLQSWLLGMVVAGIASVREDLRINILVFFPAFVLNVIIAVFLGQIGDVLSGEERFTALTNNPNTTGALLIISIGFAFYYFRETRSKWIRVLIVLLIAGLALMNILTGSRKNALGLGLFLVLYVLFIFGKKLLVRAKGLTIFSTLIALYVFAVPLILHQTLVGTRFQQVIDNPYLEEKRMLMYVDGWELFINHPIAGVGLGNYRAYSFYAAVAHSEYMEILSSTGLIGFLIYMTMLFTGLRRMLRVRKLPLQPNEHHHIKMLLALFVTDLVLYFGKSVYMSPINLFQLFTYFGYAHGLEMKYKRLSGGNIGATARIKS